MTPRDDAWLDVVASDLATPLPLRVRGRSMVPTLQPGDEVLIEPVEATALVHGDWIVVRNVEGGFLHRYLGLRDGQVLTKGDGHAGFDPLWPPEAVVGRVVEARRDGRCFYRRTPGRLRREWLLAVGHCIAGDVWGLARRVKALFLAFLALSIGVSLVAAAVTLTDFYAEVGADRITLYWETASETNNLGFYLWRSLTETVGYENISDFIVSQDEGAGAFYEYEDINAVPGVTYYYKLQDVPDNGSNGEFTDPITASIALPTPTPTPTASPTPGTPTATPTSGPTATSTPVPPPGSATVRFWAAETDLDAGDCTTLQWQTDNIKAVFLDGNGVLGDGAVTLCPCKTETHVLSVTYLDDTTQAFEVTLDVTGVCAGATSTITPTVTPTPGVATSATPTSTPLPTPTRPAPTPTRSTATPLPTKTAEPLSTLTPTPEPVKVAATAKPTPSPSLAPQATATRGVVQGDSQGVGVEAALSVWLLVVGGIIGLGFVGAGVVMWKRRQ